MKKFKRMKKLLAVMLAAVMVLSMGTSVFAIDNTTYTIKINNDTSGYTYTAYQIFAGDLSSDGKTLSNVVFGSALSTDDQTRLLSNYATTLGSAYESSAAGLAAALAANVIDAESFAEYIASTFTLQSGTTSTASGGYSISVTGAGYYLIASTTVPEAGTYSSYILRVVGSVSVDTKSSVPSVTKTTTSVTENIGDTISYTLTATLPSNYADYDSYKLTFHDTLSTGLSYVTGSVAVKVGDSTIDSTCYAVSTMNQDGCALEITITNTKALTSGNVYVTTTASSSIVVTYNATLNENAVMGNDGNANTAHIVYSNNPYDSYSYGTSTTKTTKTYTTEISVVKTDSSGNRLTGAAFTLTANSGSSLNKVVVSTVSYSEDNTDGTYYKLKTGEYTTVSPDDPGADQNNYESITTKYTATVTSETKESSYTASVGDDGVVTFSGLEAGTYTLTESTTPNGYNTISPITVELSYNESSGWTVGTSSTSGVSVDSSTGVFSVTVVNYTGSELPTTGGVGTTIFYLVGTILALGAAVILVTRRRMAR